MINCIEDLKKEVQKVLSDLKINVHSIRKAKNGDGIFIYKEKGCMGLFVSYEDANYKGNDINLKIYIENAI